MLKSRDRFRSRDVSKRLFGGLGLGLEACGLGLEGSGLGLKYLTDDTTCTPFDTR